MTLDDLAAQAGISASHLSRLERSQTLPSFTVLAKIAEVLGVGIDEFVRLERDVTALDAELRRYLDMLAIAPPVRDELFDLSIEARRTMVTRFTQLAETRLTSLAVQVQIAQAFGEAQLADAWKSLTRVIRQSGLSGPAFMRAWGQLLQTPGPRVLLLTDRSFFLLPSEADLVEAHHSVFRDEPINPSIVDSWQTSEWFRDPALARRWPTRILISRAFVDRALTAGNLSPSSRSTPEQARQVFQGWLTQLEEDASFELAITDLDLGPFNIRLVDHHAGLLERLPERRPREGVVRAGLWVSGPELAGAVAEVVNRLWDQVPENDRRRDTVSNWLQQRLSGTAGQPAR